MTKKNIQRTRFNHHTNNNALKIGLFLVAISMFVTMTPFAYAMVEEQVCKTAVIGGWDAYNQGANDALANNPYNPNPTYSSAQKECYDLGYEEFGGTVPPGEDGNSDGGDPLIFSLSEKSVNVIKTWPEWDKSRLTQFDLYNTGEKVTLSRELDEGTMTLFLDFNLDGKLSNGAEWLYHQRENVYQILSRPSIDSNQNGWFDYSDILWNIAMVKDGEKYYHASELGITAINWSHAMEGHGDMFGKYRQYSDCLYEGKYLFPNCTAVSDNHFAIMAYNKNSILTNDGKTLDSFGMMMGHINTEKTS